MTDKRNDRPGHSPAPADLALTPVARLRSPFAAKFGIPRQSGAVPHIRSQVVFEPPYRNEDALRGIEGFSHLWLIWQFTEFSGRTWSPTVRPPRLRGQRVGVFASRSTLRPNPLALSSVELLAVRSDPQVGPVLEVGGADLMDGTPIYDIKPYLASDAHPNARHGYVDAVAQPLLEVHDKNGCLDAFTPEDAAAVRGSLAQDPRPHFHDDATRLYGMTFAGKDVKFRMSDGAVHIESVITPGPADTTGPNNLRRR